MNKNKKVKEIFYTSAGDETLYDDLTDLIEEQDLDDGDKIEIYELKEVKTLKKYTLV